MHQTGLRGRLALAVAFTLSLSSASALSISKLKANTHEDTPSEGRNWPKPQSKGVIKDVGPGAVDAATVSVASAPPSGAGTAAADFVSFGFESSFFPHYANEFSANLVDSIGARMSMPVVLRVGGTSGDLLTVNPDQAEPAVCQTGDCMLGGTGSTDEYTVGPSYFDAFKQFPNAAFTFQAPIGSMNMENTMAYVNLSWNAINDPTRVKAIALGNEPNYYLDAADYVSDSIKIQQQVTSALSPNVPMFELGDLSQDAVMGPEPYNL